jgi:hypothetical protein
MTEYTGDLADYSFARDLAERVMRQVLQVIGPVLAVVAASGKGFDVTVTALAVALAALVTIAKAVFNVKAPEGAPLWRVLLDRAGSAAAGTLLGFLPVDALNLLSVDWGKVGLAVLGSIAFAVASYFYAPPSQSRKVRRGSAYRG